MRPAHRDEGLKAPRPEEWLLIEWPEEEDEPTKYWLATLPEEIAFDRLVDLAKLRWRIERDYQELKQELGLGHYAGRWRGFHHHATLCIAAYGFPDLQRETVRAARRRARSSCDKPALPLSKLSLDAGGGGAGGAGGGRACGAAPASIAAGEPRGQSRSRSPVAAASSRNAMLLLRPRGNRDRLLYVTSRLLSDFNGRGSGHCRTRGLLPSRREGAPRWTGPE